MKQWDGTWEKVIDEVARDKENNPVEPERTATLAMDPIIPSGGRLFTFPPKSDQDGDNMSTFLNLPNDLSTQQDQVQVC
jgi:hypothetical protein